MSDPVPSIFRTDPATIDYPFPLRPGFSVRVRLPVDLTKSEAERLAVFIRSIAVPEHGEP